MPQNRILITGATGNVGKALINIFPHRNRLRAAVRDVDEAAARLGDDIDYVQFDFTDPSTYSPAFEGVQSVFLVRPPALANVKAHIAPAVEAARAAGVTHIVFLSLVGVEKNPVVPHHKIETLIREIASPEFTWTFLRASFFMQNLNTTHRQEIRQQSEITVPVGKGKTSFIDVRDVAAVAVKTLLEPEHRNKAYELTGSEALDYYEVADIFSDELGQSIRYTNPSLLRFFWKKWRSGIRLPFVLVMMGLYTLTRFGMAAKITNQVQELIGRPPITLRQYIQDYRASWQP